MFAQKLCHLITLLITLLPMQAAPLPTPLRLAYWGPWHIACGIAVYTENLVNALQKTGYDATVYEHTMPYDQLLQRLRADKINVLDIQYETSVFKIPVSPAPTVSKKLIDFMQLIKKIKALGIKIVITVHGEDRLVEMLMHRVDKLIYHKPPIHHHSMTTTTQEKIFNTPLPTSVFEPPADRTSLRAKYGYNKQNIILTTMNFLFPNRHIPDILELLVPVLKEHAHYHVQLITPYATRSSRDVGAAEEEKIRVLITKHQLENQVAFFPLFLPHHELLERLYISDVGYTYRDVNTVETSSATKEFAAARLPFVVTNSSHFHDFQDQQGAVVAPMDKEAFVRTLSDLAADAERRAIMRAQLEEKYASTNVDVLIKEHIALFEGLLGKKSNAAKS